MEIYKTLRDIASMTKKIAAVTFVVALPYICNDGCVYSGKTAEASEISAVQEVRNSQISETKTLETFLEK